LIDSHDRWLITWI